MSGVNRPGAYDADTRRSLETALAEGRPLLCPHCGVALSQQEVAPQREVAYVRHRVWVICPGCRRTAGLDRRGR